MKDTFANAQLDLACRVGSREAIIEALEEGADINFRGNSPLILAILARDRATVTTLVELGADVRPFLPDLGSAPAEDVTDALMRLAPAADQIPEEDPVDAKLVRSFDRIIRNHGLAEPLRKKRGDQYPAFRDGLKWIAAEECHAVVVQFLELLGPGLRKEVDGDLHAFLKDNEPRVEELSKRYVTIAETPTELLKDYLKDRKRQKA